ncbi:MAG: heme exporter protein CcmD [Pseudomonadota bacterium]
MNIELGRYAVTVLGAYGVTLALLAALIGLSLLRAARVRRALAEIEADRRSNG